MRRRSGAAVGLVAIAGVLLAFPAQLAPTSLGVWDATLTAALVTVMAVFTAGADRRVVLAAAVVTSASALQGDGGGSTAAAFALGGAAAVVALGIRLPVVKSAVGVALAQALLRLTWPRATGGSTAVSAFVVLLVAVAALARWRTSPRRVALGGTAALAVAAIGACGASAIAAGSARHDLERAVAAAKSGFDAARAGDQVTTQAKFAVASSAFAAAQRHLEPWWSRAAVLVPIAAPNLRTVDDLVRAGRLLSDASARTAAKTDVQALRVRGAALDLAQLHALRAPLDELFVALLAGERRVATKPSEWLVAPLADRRADLADRVHDAFDDVGRARDAARVLPGLLGADGPRRYFLALQTPSEARGSGGIIGSYGILTATNGQLDLSEVHRAVPDLNTAGDNATKRISGPPDYLARYARFDPAHTWQNVTMSPDFPTVARVIGELYPQSGGAPVDGVVSADPFALAGLLRLTGPITVPDWPEPITADNVVPVTLSEQYIRFPKPERIDFQSDLARGVFDKLRAVDLPQPAAIAEALAPAVRGRHLQIFSGQNEEQRFLRRIGVEGSVKPMDGDSLRVVTQNASGNKIDWYLHRTVRDRVELGREGAVRASVDIVLRNDAPATGLPEYVIGTFGPERPPPGSNRTILSVYTPLELEQATADGKRIALQGEVELGRNVFSTFLVLPPSSTTTVHLELKGTIAGPYRLELYAQPTAQPDTFDLGLSAGKRVFRHHGPLDRDRRFAPQGPASNRRNRQGIP